MGPPGGGALPAAPAPAATSPGRSSCARSTSRSGSASRCCWSARWAPTGFGRWSVLLAVLGFVSYFGSLGLAQVAVERAAADPDRAAALVRRAGHAAAGADRARSRCCRWASACCSPTTPRCGWPPCWSAPSCRCRCSARSASSSSCRCATSWSRRSRWATASSGPPPSGCRPARRWAGRDRRRLPGACPRSPTSPTSCWRCAPRRCTSARSRPLWPTLLRQGLPVGIGGLLTLGYGYMDQVIVFEIAGVRDAGLYGAVYRIYERAQFLPAAIMTTLFPLFVSARDHDPERVRRLFHTAVDYLRADLPAGAGDHARGPRADHAPAVRRRLRRRRAGAAAADGHLRRGVARLPHRLPDRRLPAAAQLPG